jgi:hypothetical protein
VDAIEKPAPVWARIRDPRSNGGEKVTSGWVNLAAAEGIGVHEDPAGRVIKARFSDGSERTLDAVYADDDEALDALIELVRPTI